jgi:tetratricopeptide (TPR) repeat protein
VYREALVISPAAPKLEAALASAYYREHDYDAMIAQALRYTRLAPNDADAWSSLGLAYQRAQRFASAAPAYERALRLLRDVAAKHPTQDALSEVADTSLDIADVYVSLGDPAAARRSFEQANAYGDRLEAKDPYSRLKRNVKERTQEGLVAVALAAGADKQVVSIAPWSGPDLPGSQSSTLKYRLIVAAPAEKTVTLAARGLRPDWIASFCADGLCSPRTVSFKSPPGGVKTYEFQLVPPHDGAQPGSVAIAVSGGNAIPVPAARNASK